MKNIELNDLANIQGGDFIGGACLGLAAVDGIWAAGVLATWWSPPGAIAGGILAVASLGCVAYGLSQL